MAIADGSILIDTKIDDTGLEKGVRNIRKNLGGFGKAMGKTLAVGIGAATSAITTLGVIGAKYNSDMENYTTNFKVMLGSQEAAVRKVEELKEFAAKTPFAMGELAEATQTLLAFQVSADESQEVLRMLGDVALGDKEKLKGLALVFGQVSSAGKLQGQDLNQIEDCRVA